MKKILVPPIKLQGIKTKLVPFINESVPRPLQGRWIEPFCGSGVVALNILPDRALLADTNRHIIAFYQAIQVGTITPAEVRCFLEQEGTILARRGQEYYYEVRERFNQTGQSLDFLFLNRACFNGVMRFNRYGRFNVPFCHKPQRFERAYITKIVNQVKAFSEVVRNRDWQFQVADFRTTLSYAQSDDFVYADPPYAGRHVDYFNSWNAEIEADLVMNLKNLPCKFLLSSWHSNKHRENQALGNNWSASQFFIHTHLHFYHVGATEDLRNAMTEALVANYPFPALIPAVTDKDIQRELDLFEFV